MGASGPQGDPPNHWPRWMRTSVCPYIDTQFDATAPDDAALNRSVWVMILLVMWPPPDQPILVMRSPSASPFFDEVIDAGHHVEVGLVEVVSDHVAEKFVAVSPGAAVVGLEDHPAAVGEHLDVGSSAAEAETVR